MKKILLTINLLLVSLILASCSLLDNFKNKYEVRYYHDQVLIKEEKVVEGSMITAPSLELPIGYEIDAWYKDLNKIESKWDFSKDEVKTNLELHALVTLKSDYLKVTNFKITDNYLSWDQIEGATYLVNDMQSLENKIDLDKLNIIPLTEKIITVKALKDGFKSLNSEVLITYQPKDTLETQFIDMEAFDLKDFKELNRATFKSSLIDMEDFHLFINEGRLTALNESPKDGNVSLVLRKAGFLHLKEEIYDFSELSFDIATYNQYEDSKSTLNILASNDDLNFINIKTVTKINASFTNVSINPSDLEGKVDLNNLTFKLETNIDNRNIIIDNIRVIENVSDYYKIVNKNDESITLGEYYKKASGLKGEALINELRFIISANLNPIKYSDIKEILEFADSNLEDSNTVYGIYDDRNHKANWGKKSDWHREHVWPNSRLGMDRVKESDVNQGSDPHNLRAITPSTNSSRSNRFYNNSELEKLGHTIGTNAYYPGDDHRGDVSRILFYMVVRYEFLGLTDSLDILARKAYTKEASYMGLLSVLLDWHKNDPVNNFEIKRNEVIYEYQNNRNPFIDHPELLEEVFNYYQKLDEVNMKSFNEEIILVDISFFKREEILFEFLKN